MINTIKKKLHNCFKKKHVMQWLESSFQPKGLEFNPFFKKKIVNKQNGCKNT